MDTTAQKEIEALSNIEAERAILGAILFDNDIIDQVADFLAPEDFYWPVHNIIYSAVLEFRAEGKLASPIILNTYLKGTEGFPDDGSDYLSAIASAVPATYQAADYGKTVSDISKRRQLYMIGKEISGRAAAHELDDDAEKQGACAEEQIADLFKGGSKKTSKTVGVGIIWVSTILVFL